MQMLRKCGAVVFFGSWVQWGQLIGNGLLLFQLAAVLRHLRGRRMGMLIRLFFRFFVFAEYERQQHHNEKVDEDFHRLCFLEKGAPRGSLEIGVALPVWCMMMLRFNSIVVWLNRRRAGLFPFCQGHWRGFV